MSEKWVKGVDYPEWLTEEGLLTLKSGYLQSGESPSGLYRRVANAAASKLAQPDLADIFYSYMWKNWLCLSSPVAANMGTARGLPISCYGSRVPDSVDGIYDTLHENAVMSKTGGGVGVFWGKVRGKGSSITGNGISKGVIPWMKVQDSSTIAVSQGETRKGASVAVLPIDHPDIHEFLRIRQDKGDPNRKCLNIHHSVTIPDSFMRKLVEGDKEARDLWSTVLRMRLETGEPYLIFIDNVNNTRPESYVKNGLFVEMSQLCSEIFLHTDDYHSFVCCLSSVNLARYKEWKDTPLIEHAIYFLDGVMEEYIQKARNVPALVRAVHFAEKSRALGLGALGWHSLLQNEGTPFNSLRASLLNKAIWHHISTQAKAASRKLAERYGEVEWTKGVGVRNTHVLAIAPTVTNAILSADEHGEPVSQSIEPWASNVFTQKSAKGNFIRYNPTLKRLLATKGADTSETWSSILEQKGSVQHLSVLSVKEKEMFLTAHEIDQLGIIKQAADRQKMLDQGQSLNLFLLSDADPAYVNKLHLEAHKQGLYSLYYVRSRSAISGDVASRSGVTSSDCTACEG